MWRNTMQQGLGGGSFGMLMPNQGAGQPFNPGMGGILNPMMLPGMQAQQQRPQAPPFQPAPAPAPAAAGPSAAPGGAPPAVSSQLQQQQMAAMGVPAAAIGGMMGPPPPAMPPRPESFGSPADKMAYIASTQQQPQPQQEMNPALNPWLYNMAAGV